MSGSKFISYDELKMRAKIAGVPGEVLNEADRVLARLEQQAFRSDGFPDGLQDVPADSAGTTRTEEPDQAEEEQMTFIQFRDHPAVELIRSLDLMNLTPSGAIRVLEELKESVKDL